MGYNTYFNGHFKTNKKVDEETYNLLKGLATTRRMKRDMTRIFPEIPEEELKKKYGEEGEFYVEGDGCMGQDRDDSILNFNHPPCTQPGLWCQWQIDDDHRTIAWDGGEKFYEYVPWIEYILDRILKPRGYVLNGEVKWNGEDDDDMGKIIITENEVKVKYGHWEWD